MQLVGDRGGTYDVRDRAGDILQTRIETDLSVGEYSFQNRISNGIITWYTNSGGLAERMRLTASGNLGVGTSNPSSKLHVAGDTTATGNLTVDTTTLVVDATNNRVGIGTASPTAPLEVAGNVKASGVVFPDGTQTNFAPANSRIRGINFIAGCDTCSVLLDTDDQQDFYINVIGSMTINSLKCFSDAGTPSIMVQRDDGSPANLLTANLSCTTAGATGTLAGAEITLGLDDRLDFQVVAAGGVAKRITLVIKTTVN
jgi:hypothetical protein